MNKPAIFASSLALMAVVVTAGAALGANLTANGPQVSDAPLVTSPDVPTPDSVVVTPADQAVIETATSVMVDGTDAVAIALATVGDASLISVERITGSTEHVFHVELRLSDGRRATVDVDEATGSVRGLSIEEGAVSSASSTQEDLRYDDDDHDDDHDDDDDDDDDEREDRD